MSLAGGTWWLLRARWRITYNSFVRGASWRRFTYFLVAAALAFLTLVGLAISYGMTRAIVNLTGSDQAADAIVGTTLTGGITLSILVGFTVALAALYLSADLDMLLVAPVPRRAVFTSKLVGGLLPTQAVVLSLIAVPLIGHGMALNYDRWYYIAVVAAIALLPILPTAVGALSVMLIVRRVPANRLGEVVGLIVVAITLSIALVAGSARELREALTLRDLMGILDRLRSPYSPAEWLTRGVTASGRHDIEGVVTWFGVMLLATAVVLVPLIILSEKLYYEGWMNVQSAETSGDKAGGRMPWNRVDRAQSLSRPSGLVAWLPAPAAAVVQKDFRTIPRDLTNMAQVLSPLAIGVFFILQQLLYPIRIGGADTPQPYTGPLLAMMSAAISAGVSAMIMSRFGLAAFSAEGAGYWILKSSPVSRRDLLGAKFLVGYLPYLGLGFGLVLLLETARAFTDARQADGPIVAAMWSAFDPLLIGYAWLVVAIVGAGVLALTLALGTARPNLNWDSPHEMLTPDVGCLSMVLYGAYGAVAMLFLIVPAAVSGFPMLGHKGTMWALGLTMGLAVTAIVVLGSFWLAHAEIDSVGE